MIILKFFKKSANHSPESSTCQTTSCDVSCKCTDDKVCNSGTCTNNSTGCYENDQDVFYDKCKMMW